MAKRKMPTMAEAEKLETKIEKPVEEPTEVEATETEEVIEESEAKEEVEAPVEEKKEPRFVTVCIDKQLRLRAADTTASDVLMLLDPNTKCEVIEDRGEWIKVNIANKIGYVMSKFVK